MKTATDFPAGIRALPWLDSFAVGHDGMDDEHRSLLAACNDLCALALNQPDGETVRRAARALIADVEAHFASEEAIFPDIGYQGRQSHMQEHLAVLDSLNALLVEDRSGMDMAVAASTSRLLLVEHIIRHDLEFKTWVLHAEGR